MLYDDRDAGAGEKFADAELLGAPLRLTVGRSALESRRDRGAASAAAREALPGHRARRASSRGSRSCAASSPERRAGCSASTAPGRRRRRPPPDAPLRPWTIPNAIGYAARGADPGDPRARVPLAARDRRRRRRSASSSPAPATTPTASRARLTGQYSRLGALLDPVVDRLLVLAGVAVCWSYELLPRWLLALVLAREALMLVLGQAWVRRGHDAADQLAGADRRRADAVRHLARAARRAATSPRGSSSPGSRWRSSRPRSTCATGCAQTQSLKLSLTLWLAPLYSLDRGVLGTGRLPPDPPQGTAMDDTFPDLSTLNDQELKDLIQQLSQEEQEVSYRRRLLHGKIDILRAELVNRLRGRHADGEDIFSGRRRAADRDPRRPRERRRRTPTRSSDGTRWLCTAPSVASSTPKAPTTARSAARCSSSTPAAIRRRPPTGSARPAISSPSTSPRSRAHAAALVIRAGGGRAGESFAVDGERMTIGRRPDSAIFLDDITVSRDHALLVRRGSDWFLDDCGSLNGTYVNRERIDSQRLADGDELQVGKYKLDLPGRDEHRTRRSRRPEPRRARRRRRARSAPSARRCRPSSPTSRSRRSATSRTSGC